MEDKKLNRVFDRVKLSREREEAMLADLLREEKKEARPVRNRKKPTAVFAAAAAMLLTVCALAVSEPVWQDNPLFAEPAEPRTEAVTMEPALLDALGAGPEDVALLCGGVFTPDVMISDESGTLAVRQAWADRYKLIILWDFTAPEGAILDESEYRLTGSTPIGGLSTGWRVSDADGQTSHGCGTSGWASFWTMVEDESPADNRIALRQVLFAGGGAPELIGGSYTFHFTNLRLGSIGSGEAVLKGNWSGGFALPEDDPGVRCEVGQPLTLDGKVVTLDSFYASPVAVTLELGMGALNLHTEDYRAAKTDWREHVFLITSDGERIAMQKEPGTSGPALCGVMGVGRYSCWPEHTIDPAEIAAVELFGQVLQLPRSN